MTAPPLDCALPPLGLYVHLPWCAKKCPYCDFNSHTLRAALPEAAYVDALLADLEQDLPWVQGRRVQTIFIGGGTPSLFSPAAVTRLLDGIRARVPVEDGAEITLEANPGTADAERFDGFRRAGVNRLSIGVQSFDTRQLTTLGRIHGPDEAIDAARGAITAGFGRFNLDLMYALPGQTPAQASADIETAVALGAPHISAYQLTIEPHTAFHAAPPPLPDEDTAWDIEQAVESTLRAAGFRRYEVSAYARPGEECRHNLNYWSFGDYLGIGAGAHAKLTAPEGCIRLAKVRGPREYLEKAGTPGAVASRRRLSRDDVVFEFALNAFRLAGGFAAAEFETRTGVPRAALDAPLAYASERGLLTMSGDRIRASERGWRYLNDLLLAFMPAHEAKHRERSA